MKRLYTLSRSYFHYFFQRLEEENSHLQLELQARDDLIRVIVFRTSISIYSLVLFGCLFVRLLVRSFVSLVSCLFFLVKKSPLTLATTFFRIVFGIVMHSKEAKYLTSR